MVQNRSGNDSDTNVKAKFDIAGFFTSGWSHLVRMMSVNALFIVFNIPSILICFLLSFVFLPVMIPAFDWERFVYIQTAEGKTLLSAELYFLLVIFFICFLLSGLLVCIGPFQAGFTQVYRDIRNGTSFSLFGSFKTGLKNNWKKSFGAMFIGIIVTAIILLAISFYLNLSAGVGTIIGIIFEVLLVFFVLVQNYVYNMIVSTDLKLSKIYKNAILFVLIRFLPSLGLSLVVIVFNFLIPFVLLMSASYVTLGLFVFLYSFLVISWTQYLLSYYSGVLIDRYVLPQDISENEEKTNEFELELKDSKEETAPEESSEDISDV